MWIPRVPLENEPINGTTAVAQYDRYAALFMRPEYRLTVRQILQKSAAVSRVLDIGTGSGRLAIELAVQKRKIEIVGLDVSGDMLRQAGSLAQKTKTSSPINFIQATAACLPFPDNYFDVVTSYASLHHWQQPIAVFNEIWRVTNTGGLIIVRDNRRMLGHPLYKAAIRLYSLIVRREERGRWPKSIMASYTVEEVQKMLLQTYIQNYRVYPDMAGFDLCIEARKGLNADC